MEKQPKTSAKFDPLIQSEEIAFADAELVKCDQCSRNNPPNRPKCLYCGGLLDGAADSALCLRKLEGWESGYNLIFCADASGKDIDRTELARLLRYETSDIDTIMRPAVPLPVCRVETEREAALIQARLSELGMISSIIADAALAAGRPPTRIRSIEFLGEAMAFHDFNTGAIYEIAAENLALIVSGSITRSRLDSIERKRRGGRTTLIDESATVSDDIVLDIYTRQDAIGFRAYPTGFDFSSLGSDKGLLARDNFGLLITRLCEHAPGAKLVDSYSNVRGPLGLVWEVAVQNDLRSVQRSGFGKQEFASVATTSNLDQFTRFSRLQWHLL